MVTLTNNQIADIEEWLNNWDQLKHTSIPLHFKEDYTYKLIHKRHVPFQKVVKKPPLGLIPKFIHDEHRQSEILSAFNRYAEEGKIPPKEWITEYAYLCELSENRILEKQLDALENMKVKEE